MINKRQFLSLISKGSFRELFVSELGWNRFRGQAQLPAITVDEVDYCFTTIAERNGFQILTCSVNAIPTNSICKKIDTKLRRQANDYIAIFQLGSTEHHLWVVPVKANEKRDLVLVEYETAEKADLLYSKIEGFSFNIGEDTTIVDLRSKVQGAFAVNSEKITKDFYAGFKKEHSAFVKFISGIDDDIADKENKNKHWYTSIMLNRLMFCYFIQKKGFLNLDFDYLRHKLEWVRKEQGENRFFNSFYKGFLVQLFHDGLNAPVHDAKFEKKYGKIPYLNGGMFDTHILEDQYPDIEIDDNAFIRLFDFFDTWRWHLDTRITASGKDINPDVLGYIFEQYINDRAQMGAYYTKEDITEYIGRNCILPFLFDKVRSKNADAFKPDGFVWSTLRNSGDRYIFDAVKRGSDRFDEIPEEVSRGIITEAMHHEYSETPVGEVVFAEHIPLATLRSEWNKPTPEQWALPTEIWRETIERLQRCQSIIAKISAGEITSINDFITYNLDIRLFAADLLASADRLFIKHFYDALQSVTILDPTCGSGAFLFAAMNILEPLYEACIERMQEQPDYFKTQLAEISDKYRSNIQYFIFKSIILRNLYGVDIMVEATEIAKLRLFLKMVAVVDVDRRQPNLGLDPLPDIDFNIRCGNTLVGYANEEQLNQDLTFAGDILQELANQQFKKDIKQEMEKVATTFDRFKEMQLTQDVNLAEFKQAKADLRTRLAKLNRLLNHKLFFSTHVNASDNDIFASALYANWKESHQPFHWLAEFYQIIHGNGGFDVIIGNPPYVEIAKNNIGYSLSNEYKDLYAYVMDRSLLISRGTDFIGFIIPISFNATPGFSQVFSRYRNGSLFISCYADSAKLFQVTKRLSIVLKIKGSDSLFMTRYIKENIGNNEGKAMSYRLSHSPYKQIYDDIIQFNGIPAKISFPIEERIIRKYFFNKTTISNLFYSNGVKIYYTRAIRNFRPFYDFIPCHKFPDGSDKIPTETKSIQIDTESKWNIICLLNSSITFLVFSWFTDVRNINPGFINSLRIPQMANLKVLQRFGLILMKDYNLHKEVRYNKTNGCMESYYFPVKSKPIIDEIDKVLAVDYGFTDEELDFIINYDIKYRMGDELNSEE
ncbi:MAG: DNA methyltransferase [Sodaliphilus sp.]|nr:DNA methyltransferase [Sodaliphilus sp.]